MNDIEEKMIKFMEDNVKGVKFHSCKSSNIFLFGYEAKELNLWVIFKNKKWAYKYKGVTQEMFEDLMRAESKGKWVNANLVKPKINYSIYEIVGL